MKKNKVLILISFILVVALGVVLLLNNKTAPTTTPTVTTSPSPKPVSSDNISVTSPTQGEAVSSPFTLKGEARVFENVLNYELKDSSGNILKQGTMMADAPDVGKFGPFSAQVRFSTTDTTGTLEVFSLSAKDGSRINLVTIPVRFLLPK